MEKAKKELKIYSVLILVFVAFALVKSIVSICINGFPKMEPLPEGVTPEVANVLVIITFVVSLLLLIPQIYIGLKGVMISNGASVGGKAHLVWAIILAVCAAIATIDAFAGMFKAFNVDNVLTAFNVLVDLALYVCYYIYARKVAN